MENRKITVVSTTANTKLVIETNATTLEELKRDLDAANLNYEGMVFYEGLSRTELIDDDSQLPHDVTRTNRETGEVETTNELLFLLSPSAKKYNSGVSGTNEHRTKLFNFIRKNKLQDDLRKKTGKSFTNCSTEVLENFVSKYKAKVNKNSVKEQKECECKKETPAKAKKEIPVEALILVLMEKGILDMEDIKFLKCMEGATTFIKVGSVNPEKEEVKDTKCPYSDEEISEIVNSLR